MRTARYVLAMALLASGVVGACGGSSFEKRNSDEGGGTAGENGGGGAMPGGKGGTSGGKGGTSGTAGTGPAGGDAGTANGGKGGTAGGSTGGISGAVPMGGDGGRANGGTSGSAGTTIGGAGGEPGACLLPPESGPCLALMTRFASDPKTGLCLPFTYGGCEGNDNNFLTPELCYSGCPGDDPGFAYCTTPLDCALTASTCCGDCDYRSLANVVAMNKAQVANVKSAMGCNAVDCVPCELPVPDPWIGVTCRNHRCLAFDARQETLTECETSNDCRLRGGLGCCENCMATATDFVAVNRTAASSTETQQLLCGVSQVGCAGCVPTPPPGLGAACDGLGRCTVVQAID